MAIFGGSLGSIYPLAPGPCFVSSLTIPCDLRTSSGSGTSPCLLPESLFRLLRIRAGSFRRRIGTANLLLLPATPLLSFAGRNHAGAVVPTHANQVHSFGGRHGNY